MMHGPINIRYPAGCEEGEAEPEEIGCKSGVECKSGVGCKCGVGCKSSVGCFDLPEKPVEST